MCGFVPWHLRKLESSGDVVPEILPLGTFTWRASLKCELDKQKKRADEARNHQGSMRISYIPAIVDPVNDRKGSDHWGKKWYNENKEKITLSSGDYDEDRLPVLGHHEGVRNIKKVCLKYWIKTNVCQNKCLSEVTFTKTNFYQNRTMNPSMSSTESM